MGYETLTILWAVGSVVTRIVASYAYYLARSTRKRIDEANRLLSMSKVVDCPKCDGFGWIEQQRSADPQDTERADCDLCSGVGKVKAQ